jgi:hypothetical protein
MSCGCRVFDKELFPMDRLLNFTTGVSVLLIALVLTSLRRSHIRVEYSVSWLMASLIILVLSRSPSTLEAIASQLGITYPPLALMLLAGCVFVIIFYRFSVIISKLKDDNIALAQRVAILEYHLQSMREYPSGKG